MLPRFWHFSVSDLLAAISLCFLMWAAILNAHEVSHAETQWLELFTIWAFKKGKIVFRWTAVVVYSEKIPPINFGWNGSKHITDLFLNLSEKVSRIPFSDPVFGFQQCSRLLFDVSISFSQLVISSHNGSGWNIKASGRTSKKFNPHSSSLQSTFCG